MSSERTVPEPSLSGTTASAASPALLAVHDPNASLSSSGSMVTGFQAIPDTQSLHVWTGEHGLRRPVVRPLDMDHAAVNQRDADSEVVAMIGSRPLTAMLSTNVVPAHYAPLSPFSHALRDGRSASLGTTGRSTGSIAELGSGRASSASVGSQ